MNKRKWIELGATTDPRRPALTFGYQIELFDEPVTLGINGFSMHWLAGYLDDPFQSILKFKKSVAEIDVAEAWQKRLPTNLAPFFDVAIFAHLSADAAQVSQAIKCAKSFGPYPKLWYDPAGAIEFLGESPERGDCCTRVPVRPVAVERGTPFRAIFDAQLLLNALRFFYEGRKSQRIELMFGACGDCPKLILGRPGEAQAFIMGMKDKNSLYHQKHSPFAWWYSLPTC